MSHKPSGGRRPLRRLRLPILIVLAWTLVLVPLAWGFVSTLGEGALLLH